jgi:hypothetical protein
MKLPLSLASNTHEVSSPEPSNSMTNVTSSFSPMPTASEVVMQPKELGGYFDTSHTVDLIHSYSSLILEL